MKAVIPKNKLIIAHITTSNIKKFPALLRYYCLAEQLPVIDVIRANSTMKPVRSAAE